jgi:hypothetical protein
MSRSITTEQDAVAVRAARADTRARQPKKRVIAVPCCLCDNRAPGAMAVCLAR